MTGRSGMHAALIDPYQSWSICATCGRPRNLRNPCQCEEAQTEADASGQEWDVAPVICPDCLNANRAARRRCRSRGGMCGGTGIVNKTFPAPTKTEQWQEEMAAYFASIDATPPVSEAERKDAAALSNRSGAALDPREWGESNAFQGGTMVSSGSFDLDYFDKPFAVIGPQDDPIELTEDEARTLGWPGIPDHEIEEAAQDALRGCCQECGTPHGQHSDICSQVN